MLVVWDARTACFGWDGVESCRVLNHWAEGFREPVCVDVLPRQDFVVGAAELHAQAGAANGDELKSCSGRHVTAILWLARWRDVVRARGKMARFEPSRRIGFDIVAARKHQAGVGDGLAIRVDRLSG